MAPAAEEDRVPGGDHYVEPMKRCPECRRDYYDDSLLYCLDDGSALLEGPGGGQAQGREAATIALSGENSESPTKRFKSSSGIDADRKQYLQSHSGARRWRLLWIGGGFLLLAGIAVFYAVFMRATSPALQGSFRAVGSPAYDYYLRGKLDSDIENEEQNANAIKILGEVVKADPTFAPAFAELGRAYSIRANDWAPMGEKEKLLDEARVAVEKSLVLDPNLAEGHLVRAFVMWTEPGRFPHEQAIQSLKRAVEIDPNLANAHQQLGLVYLHIGLLDKARDETQKAIAIDPGDSSARLRLGLIEQYRGDYNKALSILKTVPTNTNPEIVNRSIASLLFQLGRVDEASKVVDDFLATNADAGGNVTSVKAMLLAKAGRGDDAEAAIQHAIDIGRGYQHFHHTTYNIACAYAMLNKHDEALKWLRFTIDDGFPCYPLLASDRNLDDLKGDERFAALMAELKGQWEHYKAEL